MMNSRALAQATEPYAARRYVGAWPTWQTDITGAHIDGALEPGVSFDWTSYGFSVTSTVHDLE